MRGDPCHRAGREGRKQQHLRHAHHDRGLPIDAGFRGRQREPTPVESQPAEKYYLHMTRHACMHALFLKIYGRAEYMKYYMKYYNIANGALLVSTMLQAQRRDRRLEGASQQQSNGMLGARLKSILQ